MSFAAPSLGSGGRSARRAFEFGRTYVVRPRGKHQATIVWLHGLGDNGSSWSQLLETLPLPNIKWICPTAPTQPITIFGGFPSTAWFDVGDLSEEAPDDLEGLDASAAHVANLLSTEPADIKLGVGGFSMGAATALYSATCFTVGKYGNGNPYPANLSAAVGLSGWLPCAKTLSNKLPGVDEATRRAQSFPFLLCHGRGKVYVNGKVINKAGTPVSEKAVVEIIAEVPKYVCRAGHKLEAAIEQLGVDVAGKVALDSGLSTGGFTDCLLQYGASYVYGVDVGYGQVADKIRRDERVSVIERTNLRYLAGLPQNVDLVTLDLSFISILLVMPAVVNVMKEDAALVTLVKPQFEARRSQVGRRGIVKEPTVHQEVLEKIIRGVENFGFCSRGWIMSPLKGAEGNTEFLVHFSRTCNKGS